MSTPAQTITVRRKSSTKKKKKTSSSLKKKKDLPNNVMSIPFSYTTPISECRGIDFNVGDIILIKNGIYKIESATSIVFQRFSEYTAKDVSIMYFQEDGEFLINRAIEVEKLSFLHITGWNLTVKTAVCLDTHKPMEYLIFKKAQQGDKQWDKNKQEWVNA